jgi:hypothetical protein
MIAVEYMQPESPNAEVLDAISLLSGQVQNISDHLQGFEKNTQAEFNIIHEALHEFAGHVDGRFDALESRMGSMESRVDTIESQMVTKSYLDDKIGGLKGDMVSMLKKEDQKMNRLIGVLSEKKILDATEARDVLSFKVFP